MRLRDVLIGLFWFDWPRASLRHWLIFLCAFTALVLILCLVFSWLPPSS